MTRSAKTEHRWTLLMVKDNGRVLPLRHAKGWLLFLGIVLIGAVASATVGLLLHQRAQQQALRMHAELRELQDQIDNLQQERDLLMTRLAVVQVKLKSFQAAQRESPAVADEGGQAAAPHVEQGEKEAVSPLQSPDLSAPAVPRVQVEDFRILRGAESDELRVQFKLINDTGDEEPLSGHIFVILKDAAQPPDTWLPMPHVPLRDGRPANPGRGRSFAIARFNIIRFPAGSEKQVKPFRTATVLVYAADGMLLLEKDFPVNLPAS